jgi:hypothetical protein
MKNLFKTKTFKIIAHLILGAILFIFSSILMDFESLGIIGLTAICLIAGTLLGAIFEWLQMYFSGRNSQNKVMQLMYYLNILARKNKTKSCYKDAVITGVGYAVGAVIWFYL